MADFTLGSCLVFLVIVSGWDHDSWSLWLRWVEKHEAFSVAIRSEVEEVCAQLRHVELDLRWVSISHFLQLTEDLVVVFAGVEGHNHVENVILAQDAALAIDAH